MSALSRHADPATVLNVDDNDAARSALTHFLRRDGFDVREAGTAREALDLAVGEPPDLVLLDVQLPDGDGVEVCRRLKADPATARTPVLLLSGVRVSAEDRVRGLECGADAYLTKPVEPDVVVAQARALLRARRAEAERDEMGTRFRSQVERLPLAYVLLDADCRIADWNPAAERVFGYGRGEVLGLGPPYARLLPPAAWPRVDGVLCRLRAGDMAAHSVNDNLTRDGRTITCEWFNTPVVEGPGPFRGAVCIVQDITGRLKLEEQLRQAQKMEAIGRLAGGVAHDFNNLLTIITGYGSLVLGGLAPGDPNRALVSEITKAGERGALLTRQLLTFSRQQVVVPEVLDLNEVVRDTESMLRRVIGEDVELATGLHPGLGRIRADPGQVSQVLLNLAVNARDAMPTGGKLTIETRNVCLDETYARGHLGVRPGPYVLLAVSDTGHGMTPEVQARVFEPFFTTKGPGHGTGLGLATVHGIVKQSGGHVGVSSEPGVGSTFKVYFPRAEGEPRTGKSFQGVREAPRGAETVLLVEDDEAVRALAARVLGDGGYRVLAAGNGREAAEVCREHAEAIHLLVTDVVMPEMGGRPLAEQLRALHPGLRVLYVSGYTDDAVVRHGILEAEVPFLQKPFEPAALAQKVRAVLDAPRPEGGP